MLEATGGIPCNGHFVCQRDYFAAQHTVICAQKRALGSVAPGSAIRHASVMTAKFEEK